jgi:hypothetical protein
VCGLEPDGKVSQKIENGFKSNRDEGSVSGISRAERNIQTGSQETVREAQRVIHLFHKYCERLTQSTAKVC